VEHIYLEKLAIDQYDNDIIPKFKEFQKRNATKFLMEKIKNPQRHIEEPLQRKT